MRRAFFQSLIAAFYLGLSGVLSAADAADRWVRLASQQVEGTHQTTRIDLVKLQGRYKAIRLVMRRGNAVLNRILVGYGNGQIHYEDRPINLKAGERTRPIDARDENRFLDHVEIVVETSNKGAVVEIWGLQDDKRRGDVAALHSSRNHEIPTDLTVRPTSPTPSTTFPDRTVSGNLPVRPTVDQPSATAPGQTTEGGDVLFGAQNVGFGVDRDVIRAGSEVGKFDRIRLRVLENDIHINELKVVYGNGETDSLAINADIPKNSRTNWIDLKGDRFIKEIQMDYRSKPNFHGQARVEVFGEYAQGWLGPQGEGRKYNQGWVLLGAQTAGFVGFDKDTMPVGRNEGGFRIIRVNVRDRAITLHDLKVIYTDGSSDVIPIGKKIDAGGSYGPIDLKGGQRPIDHVEVKYRSRFFDASAKGKGPAIVEIWGHNHDNDQDAVTVCPKDVCAEVPVFFGTDRKQEEDRFVSERKLASFGSTEARVLTLGKAVITVPIGEGVRSKGDVSRPSVLGITYRKEDISNDFTLVSVKSLSRENFADAVKTRLGKSEKFKDQAIVFVHGYNVAFDDALFRAAQIAHDTEFDGATLVYSWPSKGSVFGYKYDIDHFMGARDYLKEFLNFVSRETGAKQVHLIAHSMGAQLLLEVMRDLKSEAASAKVALKFNEIILAAPDISRTNFEEISKKITDMASNVTLYASANDKALSWFSRGAALGETRAGDVPKGGPVIVPGIETIDVSKASTDFFQLNHSAFGDRPHLLKDMKMIFETGKHPPDKRFGVYEPVTHGGKTYWRYEK